MAALAQSDDSSSLKAGVRRRVTAAAQTPPNRSWHVSPLIDIAAYHFSWAWVLVPMLFAAPDSFYLAIYALMMGANFAHRHYGLPYAYLDRGVFQSFRPQLTWFPLGCLVLLGATPLLLNGSLLGSAGAQLAGTIAAFAVLWNLWHTYMQKYGIMRLYSAKDSTSVAIKTSGWVDKYFLLCWFPLYFTYVGPANQELILANTQHLRQFASTAIAFFSRYETWLMLPSIAIAIGGVGTWLYCEFRAHRFRNRARLSAAAGALLISTAPLWANPVKAVIAFAFSHAVEYMVFIWAYQRRRYVRSSPAPSLMARLLRHPKTWYFGFTGLLVFAGTFEAMRSAGLLPGGRPITFLGMTGASWFFYYAVYESLIHFHMDGFLWKMRRPEVRQNI